MEVVLYTDSGSDMNKVWQERSQIRLLPISVNDGVNESVDSIDDIHLIYENMKQGIVYKTSQVPYDTLYNTFEKECKDGNEVVYITLSSGLSGTYNTAVLAKNTLIEKYPDYRVHVIDSRLAAGGQKMVVLRAAKILKKYPDIDKALALIEESIQKTKAIFYVDDMQYLYRGGRVTKTQQVLTGLLNIKVLLEIETVGGTIVTADKARGEKGAIKKMLDVALERSGHDFLKEQTVFIQHADNMDAANRLEEAYRTSLGAQSFDTDIVYGVIGAHLGPGAITSFFLSESMSDPDLNIL